MAQTQKTNSTAIALVAIIIIAGFIGGFAWLGHYTTSSGTGPHLPTQETICFWNKTLVPAAWPTVLTASFTLPAYSSAVLHVEWTLTFKYHYLDDRVAVQTTLNLDSAQLEMKPYSYTLSYVYEKSIAVTANTPHTVTLSLVIMVQGPGYSTFNETATGWVSYRK